MQDRPRRLASVLPPRSIPTTIGLALIATCAVACHKGVPASTKPLIDSIRPTAESVAAAAAARCGAEFASGRFVVSASGCSSKLLPGEKVMPPTPSPAKGTALERDPNVIDVRTTCNAPTSGSTSCGQDLDPLRMPPAPFAFSGVPDRAESSCQKTPDDCEEIATPSRYAKTKDSVDLRIVRPVTGGPAGATAEVVVAIAKKD